MLAAAFFFNNIFLQVKYLTEVVKARTDKPVEEYKINGKAGR